MIKRQEGFTMVELLITMVIFVFTIAAASSIFVPLLTQFKQQSKLAETQTEGIVGLDLLRRDIEQAGFGLFSVLPESVGFAYIEGSGNTEGTVPAPSTYNDASNVPRAIVAGDNVAGLGSSDYLVIKATSVAVNDTAMKWTYVVDPPTGGQVRVWGNAAEDLNDGDYVIVLDQQRMLIYEGGAFSVAFNQAAFPPPGFNNLRTIYGVDPDTSLRMPFNRADYYIRRVAGTTIPARCAPGTGVLMKSVINQSNGNRGAGMPLLDCVADMQVIFGFDMDEDGERGTFSDANGGQVTGSEIATVTQVQAALNDATRLRRHLKEVRVYILAHEGQRDTTFTYPTDTVTVGEMNLGRDYDLTGITNWQNYRWKVYVISLKLNNLGA